MNRILLNSLHYGSFLMPLILLFFIGQYFIGALSIILQNIRFSSISSVRKFLIFRIPAITIFLFSLGFYGCNNEKIIAEIGEHKIFESEFVDRYENYILQTGIKDNLLSRKEVLNSMISEILLLNFDDNNSIFNSADFIREKDWLKDQAVLAFLKDREVYAKIEVTDEEIREAFLRSNQKIAARHLFAANEEEINNVKELLEIGVDFNTLAKQLFTDSTLQNNGGYLGYFSWGDMEPEFEDKAFSMKIGEISEPVKTKHGYSIIKLEDRVTHPLLTENEYLNKKDKFAQILRIRKKTPSEKSFINEVVKFDKITFNENSVDDLWNKIELKVRNPEDKIDQSSNVNVVAEYNGRKYSVTQLLSELDKIPPYHFSKITSPERLKTVIKGIILKKNLLNLADNKGYSDKDIVEKKQDEMIRNLFMKFKISEIIENAEISDSLAYEFYTANPDFFSTHDQINVQEILVEDLELAKSLVKKLKMGSDFGDLAVAHSIRKIAAENKGILGLSPVKNFGRLKNIFASSKVNEIIGPIEIDNIYGIFKIIEKLDSEPVEFDEVKDIAYMAVKFKLKNDLVNEYVEELKSKNDVFVNLKNLGSAKIFQFD